ncbi:MAG TPA: hypothetical protein VFC78_23300 [Tepidisphaeraceae bacterium]|nr:hypothetical protein [Tepidisphaeraceae bacterium]
MQDDQTTRPPESIGPSPVNPDTPDFQPSAKQLGPIRLIRLIGRGGMGEVWLGRHELLGRDVAVKFLLAAAMDRNDPAFGTFIAFTGLPAVTVTPIMVVTDQAAMNQNVNTVRHGD